MMVASFFYLSNNVFKSFHPQVCLNSVMLINGQWIDHINNLKFFIISIYRKAIYPMTRAESKNSQPALQNQPLKSYLPPTLAIPFYDREMSFRYICDRLCIFINPQFPQSLKFESLIC